MLRGFASKDFWRIFLSFLISRITLDFIGMIAQYRIYTYPKSQIWPMPKAPEWLNIWVRWDSQWYIEIARRGYWLTAKPMKPEVYYPLYPMLMRYLAPLVGGLHYLAGLLISNISFVVALWFLFLLVKNHYGDKIAHRTILYLLLFPTGYYFSAVYTEGLFLVTTVLAFYFAEKEHFFWASFFGGLSALTRNLGVVVALPLFIEYLRRKKALRLDFLWLGLVPLATASFLYFLYLRTGHALNFIHYEAIGWGRHISWPWVGAFAAIHNILTPFPHNPFAHPGRVPWVYSIYDRGLYSLIDLTAEISFILLWIYGIYRKLPLSWLSYFFFDLLIPMLAPASSHLYPLASMSRYVVILFPAFVGLALLGENEMVDSSLRIFLPIIQALFFILFVTWNWIA